MFHLSYVSHLRGGLIELKIKKGCLIFYGRATSSLNRTSASTLKLIANCGAELERIASLDGNKLKIIDTELAGQIIVELVNR